MMISEFFASETFGLLLRVTLIALIGYTGIVCSRNRIPSLSILIARVLLVAIWIVPSAMLLGWSLDIAVLPVESRESELAESGYPATTSVVEPGMRPLQAVSGNIATIATHSSERVATLSEGPAVATSVPSVASQLVTRASGVSIAGWACGIWVLGKVFFLLSFGFKFLQTLFCIGQSVACGEQAASLASGVADRLRLTRPVDVRISNRINGPCTAGWIRPLVLLPESWMQGLSNRQMKLILAHELTHAQHRDSAWDSLARITAACWWFHPMVHAVVQQHRLACEYRCDAAAATVAGGSQAYRRQLAKWALAIRDSGRNAKLAAFTALSMAERPLLLQRLSWLKNAPKPRDISSRQKWLIAMGVTAFCTLVSIAHPTQRLRAQDGADKIEVRLQAQAPGEQTDALKVREPLAGNAESKAAVQAHREAEFKDSINSFSEFRPSKYLELQELSIVSGGKTDKGDYLFVCDTKVVWLKSRTELLKMQRDFITKFAKKHNGSITALGVVGLAMQSSIIESTIPKFESGDVHSNRRIRVRGERAGDSIIVTSVTPADFMVGNSNSGVAQLLQTLQALESDKLPTGKGKPVIELQVEEKEPQPSGGK